MGRKIRIGLIFGGRSAEHKISLISSRSIAANLNNDKYEKIFIGISAKGSWYLYDEDYVINGDDPDLIELKHSDHRLALCPESGGLKIFDMFEKKEMEPLDVVFPVLHGPYGEDGTIQGLFRMMGVPFVGCDVLASAVCMDKDIAKSLLKYAGIPVPAWFAFAKSNKGLINYDDIVSSLGLPLFVKPANLGSSVGISKVSRESQFQKALDDAFEHDSKIIIEEGIEGREIECSVLGNNELITSVPGEIIPNDDFYSYRAKYLDENGAVLAIPALLEPGTVSLIQELAKRSFRVLGCKGMARVDFFLKKDGSILVNELNTIPGFTKISMYPKLMELSGISYPDLLDRLIELAFD